MRAVPNALREGSLTTGATSQTSVKVVLPAAFSVWPRRGPCDCRRCRRDDDRRHAAGQQPNFTFDPDRVGGDRHRLHRPVALGDLPHGSIVSVDLRRRPDIAGHDLVFNLAAYALRRRLPEVHWTMAIARPRRLPCAPTTLLGDGAHCRARGRASSWPSASP
jgi:hypothetical protein